MRRGRLLFAVGVYSSLGSCPLGVTARKVGGTTVYYTRDPYGNLIDERGAGHTYYYLQQASQLAPSRSQMSCSRFYHESMTSRRDPNSVNAVVIGLTFTLPVVAAWIGVLVWLAVERNWDWFIGLATVFLLLLFGYSVRMYSILTSGRHRQVGGQT